MQVKDIMTKDVISVFENTEVKNIAEILTKERIHGVPVIDKDRKVIGIVTETNFFSRVDGDLYLSKFVKTVQENKLPDTGLLKNKNKISANTTAGEIMTKNCVTVSPELELEKLFEVFRKKGFHSIPVANGEGTLEGIITLADIIAFSAK
ncbi:MAG: IMP dehydrogenase [Candidatus Moranbacteria bacterium GW2011_GWF2_34_56]|nr:MAG: IMP dehydrogenase [Candidatus Moranbacteria bacterium GW2011_GWF1_34_10]KKP64456.1 MAG: IMP dehydrogenase [Candidatus Moranbacteria bacterium GW2011_GWF2_34_56]HBI17104.1 hypothetical protein [Candidatus Moranbacteria bacterium]